MQISLSKQSQESRLSTFPEQSQESSAVIARPYPLDSHWSWRRSTPGKDKRHLVVTVCVASLGIEWLAFRYLGPVVPVPLA